MNRFEDFVLNIARIQKALQRIKSREMADFGLKGSHVMCLFELSSHKDGLTASELCQCTREDKAAVSRIVSGLEERGLVSVTDNPAGNHYRAVIRLTEAGGNVTAGMQQKIADAVSSVTTGYSPEEQAVFRKILHKLAENLEASANSSGRK